MKGGDCVPLTLSRSEVSGAATVPGVVKYQRGYAASSEDLLHGNPVVDRFTDSVTNEYAGAWRASFRCDEDRVKLILSTRDAVAGNSGVCGLPADLPCDPAEEPVAHKKNTADRSNRDGEDALSMVICRHSAQPINSHLPPAMLRPTQEMTFSGPAFARARVSRAHRLQR